MINQSPNTILLVADSECGAINYVLKVAKSLKKHNVKVYLAAPGRKLSSIQRKESAEISNLEVVENEGSARKVGEAGKWMLELEQQYQPDLIHLNHYSYGNLPWRAPVLITCHSGILSKRNKKEKFSDSRRESIKQGLQRADCIVGTSKKMMASLEKRFGPFSSSSFINSARDKSKFHPSTKEPIIFSRGRLRDEAKHISTLAAVSNRLPWPVYIEGITEISHKAQNLHFLGKISTAEANKWLGKASIYVMPTRYEPPGLPVLEAALSGCALVLGDIPSLREVWGDAALYADPQSKRAIRHQVGALTENAAIRQHLAKKAVKRAQRYSIDHLGGQYIDLYRQLLHEEPKMAAE